MLTIPLQRIVTEYSLVQHLTRGDAMLDLVFVSWRDVSCRWCSCIDNAQLMALPSTVSIQPVNCKCARIDYVQLNNLLRGIDWKIILADCQSTDDHITRFMDKFKEAITAATSYKPRSRLSSSEAAVAAAQQKCFNSNACPDGISYKLLRVTSANIITPLNIIFQRGGLRMCSAGQTEWSPWHHWSPSLTHYYPHPPYPTIPYPTRPDPTIFIILIIGEPGPPFQQG